MKIETRVIIKDKDHPWHGHAGEIVGEDFLPVIRETKIRVRLDEGHECYAGKESLEKIR